MVAAGNFQEDKEMKAPKINLKKLRKRRRKILRERTDMQVHWINSITIAEWFDKAPIMSIAVAVRTAEILVLNREMDMTTAMKTHRKIVEAKIKLVLETIDIRKVREAVKAGKLQLKRHPELSRRLGTSQRVRDMAQMPM